MLFDADPSFALPASEARRDGATASPAGHGQSSLQLAASVWRRSGALFRDRAPGGRISGVFRRRRPAPLCRSPDRAAAAGMGDDRAAAVLGDRRNVCARPVVNTRIASVCAGQGLWVRLGVPSQARTARSENGGFSGIVRSVSAPRPRILRPKRARRTSRSSGISRSASCSAALISTCSRIAS